MAAGIGAAELERAPGAAEIARISIDAVGGQHIQKTPGGINRETKWGTGNGNRPIESQGAKSAQTVLRYRIAIEVDGIDKALVRIDGYCERRCGSIVLKALS